MLRQLVRLAMLPPRSSSPCFRQAVHTSLGGGAQVGQVAIGAISEADRHNIRDERISVDTIPLVGELPLADAVRAVGRLPRATALVLAGSLMGDDIV